MTAGSWRDRRWDDASDHLRSARALVIAAVEDSAGGPETAAILRHIESAAHLITKVAGRPLAPGPRAASAVGGGDVRGEADDRVRLSVRRDVTVGAEGLVALRAWVRETLDGWRVERVSAGAAIDIAHELTANALQHATPPIQLELELRDDAVDVIVRDGDPRLAMLRPYRAGVSDSGLGLHLVRQLAVSWGQDVEAAGKRVWARIAREHRQPPPSSRARATAAGRHRPDRGPGETG